MIIFKSPMSQDQISSLGTFMFPAKLQEFLKLYRQATYRPHGYLIVDAKTNTPEQDRFVTNIFEEETNKHQPYQHQQTTRQTG